MTCDVCQRRMNYCFYINDEYWRKVIGEEKFSKSQGHVCAHCTLEAVGGMDWEISYREPSKEMKRQRQADADEQRRVEAEADELQKQWRECNRTTGTMMPPLIEVEGVPNA